MKASEAKFLDFIKKSPQFVIPIYQRNYSWEEKECRQLWDDIIRAGSNDNITSHFVGSIVYIEKGLYHVTDQTPLLVIDGQQRLTSITLLLTALSNTLANLPIEKQEPINGFSPKKINNYYLVNDLEEGERYFKLILSETDKETLLALVAGTELPKHMSLRIKENYALFRKWIQEYSGDYKSICKGIAKLILVDISLNRDQDNPQLIFESMNSTGKELTQADLIRNFILMGLEPSQQTHLYKTYWRPMENDFGQEAYGVYFDRFMRHYLAYKTGDIPKQSDVYEAFKAFSRTPKIENDGVEKLVADIKQFASYFCAMALGAEKDPDLKKAFHDLREFKVDVSYPLLLELYYDYITQILSKDDFLFAVRLIEAYVFRRAVCSIPTNSLNKTFATFAKSLKKDRYLESIKAHFLLLPSYRRFPANEEFKRELQTRDLYNFARRSYWLRRMENFERKERVSVDEYTIEHILPQNENLHFEWQQELGQNYKTIQETWLHTLGNLTLTGYNSEYSDRPFKEKRDMPGGFKESPLRLNKGLGDLDSWNETTIKQRAKNLSDYALKVWKMPDVSPDILEVYKPKTKVSTDYSIEDHPYLLSGKVGELFNAFRKEVLALDPVVTEDFLKLYVAYKAETNFVDVVPQAKQMRLSLNMSFSDITDPRGMCKNVKGLGRWGNGDVEIKFHSLQDLPYIIGLVRQAFELQMSNDEQL